MEKVVLERHKLGDYIINYENKSYIADQEVKLLGKKKFRIRFMNI